MNDLHRKLRMVLISRRALVRYEKAPATVAALTAIARELVGKIKAEREPVVPVIFRLMRKPYRFGDDVLAIMPTIPGDMDPGTCTCYAHVGQHGICEPYHVVNHSRLATPAEYADLKAELEASPYGYRFRVYSRFQRPWFQMRYAEIKRERKAG